MSSRRHRHWRVKNIVSFLTRKNSKTQAKTLCEFCSAFKIDGYGLEKWHEVASNLYERCLLVQTKLFFVAGNKRFNYANMTLTHTKDD
jgi:hypothetical protein